MQNSLEEFLCTVLGVIPVIESRTMILANKIVQVGNPDKSTIV